MYNSFNSAPTLTNCAFVTNLASNSGGGIRNEGCSATLINCTFAANSAGAGRRTIQLLLLSDADQLHPCGATRRRPTARSATP